MRVRLTFPVPSTGETTTWDTEVPNLGLRVRAIMGREEGGKEGDAWRRARHARGSRS